MIALQITAPRNLSAQIARAVERKGAAKVAHVFNDLHEEVLANSPVHSGQFIRNWVASRGRPVAQNAPEIPTPASPGPTNSMSLGSEPRRQANEDASRATAEQVSFARWLGESFFIANGSEDALAVEMGDLPGPGFVQRQPTALTIVSAQAIAMRHGRRP